MALAPIELILISFPGNEFKGEIVPALMDLIDDGTIRVIDIIFAAKDPDGNIVIAELSDIDEEAYAVFDPLVSGASGALTADDVRGMAENLQRNSSAAIMLFEHVWARGLQDSIIRAGGQVLFDARVPGTVAEKIREAAMA